jgi:hypothetical protein
VRSQRFERSLLRQRMGEIGQQQPLESQFSLPEAVTRSPCPKGRTVACGPVITGLRNHFRGALLHCLRPRKEMLDVDLKLRCSKNGTIKGTDESEN